MLVLDSGGLTFLASRDRTALSLLIALRRRGLLPAVVPTPVLIESLTGLPHRDANVNRLLKACDTQEIITDRVARRAAHLRTQARRGSAVDALVVAIAEPGGVVLTSDGDDLAALAASATGVGIETV